MAAPISLQLYSVREACTLDFRGTLKQVADIGYAGVELAGFLGFYGLGAAETGRIICDPGMKVSGDFVAMPTRENLAAIVEQERALGNATLVAGFGPEELATEHAVKAAAAVAQEASARLRPHGLRLCIHNHEWEFGQKVGGRHAYDVLMELAPDVSIEFDIYRPAYVKADPVEKIARHRTRIPLIHLKDGTLRDAIDVNTAVGSGALDIPAAVGAADPSVLEWLVVELESCATDAMEAVARSYDYLVQTGLGSGRN